MNDISGFGRVTKSVADAGREHVTTEPRDRREVGKGDLEFKVDLDAQPGDLIPELGQALDHVVELGAPLVEVSADVEERSLEPGDRVFDLGHPASRDGRLAALDLVDSAVESPRNDAQRDDRRDPDYGDKDEGHGTPAHGPGSYASSGDVDKDGDVVDEVPEQAFDFAVRRLDTARELVVRECALADVDPSEILNELERGRTMLELLRPLLFPREP